MGLDADLISYYEAEARGGHRVALGEMRTSLRREFAATLRAEGRTHLVDVGAGPGLDTVQWCSDGFGAVGLDLAHANVECMRDQGLAGVTGSLYQLPFRHGGFEALWTMSAVVHVPDRHLDGVLAELVRVVEPAGLVGIGTWGGRDYEGAPEVGEIRPYRFFSLRSHDRWRSILERHGDVETFRTFEPHATSGWEYQFATVRTLAPPGRADALNG